VQEMKVLWELLPPFIKGVVTVVAFFIGIGWASYGAVLLIVKAEGQEIRKEVMIIRNVDMEHLNKRFDRVEALIKESK
jgi:hypothetical protein